jgi:glycosyltransferase involved in cell wall biosynthesis
MFSGGLRELGVEKRSLPEKPLVTVITAVFNGRQHMAATIESVANQSYDNIEYIVIDGNSMDGTVELLRRYDSCIDCWVSERDTGIYDAWNKGLSRARGQWIAFLGCGDRYCVDAVANYLDFIRREKCHDADYISSTVLLVDAESRPVRAFGIPWRWSSFKRRMDIAHVGSFHSSNLFKKNGTFNSSYKVAGDYEFLLRSREKLNARFFDAVTATMLLGGASETSKVFLESLQAIVDTGGRNRIVASLDVAMTYMMFKVNRLIGRR